MKDGAYTICSTHLKDDGDGLIFETLMFGYDTATEAFKELPRVATENGVSEDDCAVIRMIDKGEAANFQV